MPRHLKSPSLVLVALAWTALAGCAEDPEVVAARRAAQLHADRQQCGAYGFAPGSESFALCMLNEDERREARDVREADALEARLADQRRENAARARESDRMRDLSRQRSGNTAFPLCNAASPGAQLEHGGWTGQGCRMR